MTKYKGRRVIWSNFDSLILPGEKTIPAAEWDRRKVEAFTQKTLEDPDLIKVAREELAKMRAILSGSR